MASKNAVSLLQSIQEGLAKLTAEVDSMENKISVGPVEEYDSDEEAPTVVSLSESDCGSMGSFEKFVQCTLPPAAVLEPVQRSRIPIKLEAKEDVKGRQVSRIPLTEKRNKVKTCPLSLDTPLDVPLDAPLNASWKIGVENCAAEDSPKSAKMARFSLQTAPIETITPAVILNEKCSLTPRDFNGCSRIPGPPREVATIMGRGVLVNKAHFPQGQSRLPRPPPVHTAFL